MENQMKRILIIDDELDFCISVSDFLRQRGYATAFTIDPDEGIRMAKKTHPDLILLDIRMPGKDGISVLDILKKNSQAMSIPVIMVSALDDQATMRKAAASYNDGYITKPVSYERLITTIRDMLET